MQGGFAKFLQFAYMLLINFWKYPGFWPALGRDGNTAEAAAWPTLKSPYFKKIRGQNPNEVNYKLYKFSGNPKPEKCESPSWRWILADSITPYPTSSTPKDYGDFRGEKETIWN